MWNLSLRNLLGFSPWLKILNLWWVHISTLQSNHIFEMHSLYTFSRNIPCWCNFQIRWWNILQAVKPGNRGKLSFALPQTTFLWFTLLCCVIVKLFNSNKFICKIDSWWLINWVSAESAVEMYKACFNWTRSSWLNCALRDDEAVYWVSIGHYEAVAVGNWWYWVRRGHVCLYILDKVEIWTCVTDASLTHWQTLKGRATHYSSPYKV